MQSKALIRNLNYFSTWHLSAKLLCALIFIYSSVFTLACAQKSSEQNLARSNQPKISSSAININTANAEELEKLPRVGKELAAKIIEHREKYGVFRRSEDLIVVRGMSDKKFREIRNLIKVE